MIAYKIMLVLSYFGLALNFLFAWFSSGSAPERVLGLVYLVLAISLNILFFTVTIVLNRFLASELSVWPAIIGLIFGVVIVPIIYFNVSN